MVVIVPVGAYDCVTVTCDRPLCVSEEVCVDCALLSDLRMLFSAEYPRPCMSVFWGLCKPVVCVIVYICMYGVCLCI